MPSLLMLINSDGHSWPATSADRRLLRRKLATRAGIPYRGAPSRVEYLVSFCAAAGISVTFTPTSDPSPSPPRPPAPSPNGRRP